MPSPDEVAAAFSSSGMKPAPTPTGLGGSIAQAAESFQPKRTDYSGYCERLTADTVQHATGSDVIHGVNLRQNAIDTLRQAQRNGVGFKYTPGTPLLPGDIALSSRMGGGFGHSMVVGADGTVRSDLAPGVGQNKIDWIIRPSASPSDMPSPDEVAKAFKAGGAPPASPKLRPAPVPSAHPGDVPNSLLGADTAALGGYDPANRSYDPQSDITTVKFKSGAIGQYGGHGMQRVSLSIPQGTPPSSPIYQYVRPRAALITPQSNTGSSLGKELPMSPLAKAKTAIERGNLAMQPAVNAVGDLTQNIVSGVANASLQPYSIAEHAAAQGIYNAKAAASKNPAEKQALLAKAKQHADAAEQARQAMAQGAANLLPAGNLTLHSMQGTATPQDYGGALLDLGLIAAGGAHGLKIGEPVPEPLPPDVAEALSNSRAVQQAGHTQVRPSTTEATAPRYTPKAITNGKPVVRVSAPRPFVAPSIDAIKSEINGAGAPDIMSLIDQHEAAPAEPATAAPAEPDDIMSLMDRQLRPAGPTLRDHPELPHDLSDHVPSPAAQAIGSGALPAEPAAPVAEPAPKPIAPPLTEWKPIGNDTYSAPGGFHVSPQEGGGYEAFGPQGKIGGDFKSPGEAIAGAAEPVPTPDEAGGAKRAKATYDGPTNLDRMPEEARQRAIDTAKEFNLNKGDVKSHAETLEAAKTGGLTLDDLRGVDRGKRPPGFEHVPTEDYDTMVRRLSLHYNGLVREAADAHAEDPTPETLDAYKKANQDYALALDHEKAVDTSAGRALNSRLINRESATADQVSRILQDTPTIKEAVEGKPEPTVEPRNAQGEGPKVPDVPRPKSSRFRTVTDEDYNAAASRLKSSVQGFGKAFIKEEGGYFDPEAFKDNFEDLKTFGAYHIEKGLRMAADATGKWADKMREAMPGISKGQLSALYEGSRGLIAQKAQEAADARAQKAGKQNVAATKVALGSPLRPLFTRKNFDKFIAHIDQGTGTHDIFDKLNHGQGHLLTPEQKALVNEAYHLYKKTTGKGAGNAASKSLRKIIQDLAASKTKPQVAGPPTAEQALRTAVGNKLGDTPMSKAAAAKQAAGEGFTKGTVDFDKRVEALQNAPTKTQLFYDRMSAIAQGRDILDRMAHAGEPGVKPLTIAEERFAAERLQALKDASNPKIANATADMLTTMLRDARAGKLGYSDPMEHLRTEMLSNVDPKDKAAVDEVTNKLAALKPDDIVGMAELWNHYSSTPVSNLLNYVMSNALSGPGTYGKIGIAHLLMLTMDDLAESIGSHVSGGTLRPGGISKAITTGKAALPGALTEAGLTPSQIYQAAQHVAGQAPKPHGIIHEGSVVSALRGHDRSLEVGARLPTEFTVKAPAVIQKYFPDLAEKVDNSRAAKGVNAFVRQNLRNHSAMYHVMQSYALQKGLVNEAELQAIQEGAKPGSTEFKSRVQEISSAPSKEQFQKAVDYAKQQTIINDNYWSDLAKAAAQDAERRHQPFMKVFLKLGYSLFSKVPSNIVGRAVETSPLGLSGYSRVMIDGKPHTGNIIKNQLTKLSGGTVPPEVAAQTARVFGRGVIGTAQMLASAYAVYKYLYNAPDKDKHEYGSINAPNGRKYETGGVAPLGIDLNVGAAIAQHIKDGKSFDPASPEGLQFWQDMAHSEARDLPYINASETAQNLLDGKPKDFNTLASNTGELFVPAGVALHQIAAQQSPYMRQATSIPDRMARGIPSIPGVPTKIGNHAISAAGLPFMKTPGGELVPQGGGISPIRNEPSTPPSPMDSLISQYYGLLDKARDPSNSPAAKAAYDHQAQKLRRAVPAMDTMLKANAWDRYRSNNP